MSTEARMEATEGRERAEASVEFRENAWWLVEHRPGTEVLLPSLAPNQCVTWGDGETYHRLLTRTDATTEAEAREVARARTEKRTET